MRGRFVFSWCDSLNDVSTSAKMKKYEYDIIQNHANAPEFGYHLEGCQTRTFCLLRRGTNSSKEKSIFFRASKALGENC